jgi:hypothetical protein
MATIASCKQPLVIYSGTLLDSKAQYIHAEANFNPLKNRDKIPAFGQQSA